MKKKPDLKENIPRHVAIIPDGNRRWAKERGLPKTAGHAMGIKRIREVIKRSAELSIKVLTIYVFSTENWNRTSKEVNYLMKAPISFLETDLPKLIRQNVQVKIVGSQHNVPQKTRMSLDMFEKRTSHCNGLLLVFAFNYGSRDEMVEATRAIVEKVQMGDINKDEITESTFRDQLYTKDIPDPDLFIRTSGEKRLSNYLLWQLSYSELWFTDVLWPDFTSHMLDEAVLDYQRRKRRYGW